MSPVSRRRKPKSKSRQRNGVALAADPARSVPFWQIGPGGEIDRVRAAEHWQRLDGKVACDLCYRQCVLDDGEDGTCGFRGNRDGRMELLSHGIITSVVKQVHGYQVDPFLTYKPGQTSVFFGGQQCTAACTFCMSTNITLAPERVPWALPPDRMAPGDSEWYAQKALMHPADAIGAVRHHRASSVTFGINEPTLSFEWTFDVARLAKSHRLDVVVESNGFTGPDAIRRLAKYVDAVDVGTKGSCDPEFYERRMRSPGAVPAVLDALSTWREAGVHLIVGDLVAPPHMQPDEAFIPAARRFYGQVAERCGELTPVLITQINPPGPAGTSGIPYRTLVRSSEEENAYDERIRTALALAREAGLPYAHPKSPDFTMECHACGGPLLRFGEHCTPRLEAGVMTVGAGDDCCVNTHAYCSRSVHEQHVTGGCCDHCGEAVPVVTLSADELARERRKLGGS